MRLLPPTQSLRGGAWLMACGIKTEIVQDKWVLRVRDQAWAGKQRRERMIDSQEEILRNPRAQTLWA